MMTEDEVIRDISIKNIKGYGNPAVILNMEFKPKSKIF